MFVIEVALEMMTKHVGDLLKFLAENPTSRREVKEVAKKLKVQTENLSMQSVVEWRKQHAYGVVKPLTYHAETQNMNRGTEIAVQTSTDIYSDVAIKKCIKERNGPKELVPFLDYEWLNPSKICGR